MTALPNLPSVPAVGETGTASWADLVQAWVAFVAAPPTCHVWQNSAQSIPNNVATPVTWDQETFDTAGGHSTITNPSRYTTTYPGKYMFTGQLLLAGNASGQRFTSLAVNGTAVTGERSDTLASASGSPYSFAFAAQLAAGDYAELLAFQNCGSSLALSAGRCAMTIVWIGA